MYINHKAMKKLTLEQITELQKQYGLTKAQELLNSGELWKFEGSVGRDADFMIEKGILMLPKKRTSDYWGTIIPARTDLKDGTKGTLGLAQKFWGEVEEGDDDAINCVEQYRDFMSF
jgi:hypothetical protein